MQVLEDSINSASESLKELGGRGGESSAIDERKAADLRLLKGMSHSPPSNKYLMKYPNKYFEYVSHKNLALGSSLG